jgi:hypothetical protein
VQAMEQKYTAGNVQRSDWPAIAIQIAVATIFSGVIAYVATNPQQLAQAIAVNPVHTQASAIPVPPVPQGEPVQVANPFDATEVFQFPSGTSESDAHVAIASLLLQRARDRQHLWSHTAHRSKKRTSHTQSDEPGSAPASRSPGVFTTQVSCNLVDRTTASGPAWKCS